MTTINSIYKDGKHYITLKQDDVEIKSIITGGYWRALFWIWLMLKTSGKSPLIKREKRAQRAGGF